MYELLVDNYKKLVSENVTANYKKAPVSTMDIINTEVKAIASKLELNARIEIFPKREAFIYIKDHKPNFPHNIKCRLINPAKSEVGKISKALFDKMTLQIRSASNLMQWRNTKEVIAWFDNMPQKPHCKFIKFDIAEFDTSIPENLLLKALEFARTYINIDDDTTSIILTLQEISVVRQQRSEDKKRW